ncbi:MAG: hypothetical protein ACLFSB_07990 [Chitinispirillaceae bacterium]
MDTKKTLLVTFLLISLFFLPASSIISAKTVDSTLQSQINTYFDQLRDTFDQIASSPAVNTTHLSRTDRYFVGVLKKQQTFYSLIRTNSKGVVTNEIVRGKPPERNYRSIAYQRWFKQIQQTGRDYFGFLKKNTGRYYLFWSKPVFKTRRSGSQTFVGAIAVEIDIWDAMHTFSQTISIPFLVTLNNMSLYSHKWQDPEQFDTKDLTIPGVENITLSFVPPQEPKTKTMPAAASPTAQNTIENSEGGEEKEASLSSKSIMPVYGIIALIFIAIIAVGICIILGIRHRTLIKRIHREESLF